MTIESPLNSWLTRGKSRRIADAVIPGVLLTLTLPLVINRCRRDLDSPGPVFERKLCVGRGSTIAEDRIADLLIRPENRVLFRTIRLP